MRFVEDGDDQRTVLRYIVESLGFAAGGIAAIRELGAGDYDVIVIDLMVPL